jgi:branched-chain amino acid transport system substrate-binding protein
MKEANKMKNRHLRATGFFRALCVLMVSMLAVFSYSCRSQEQGQVTIGAVLSMTGSASVWGENSKNGIELAVEELNAAGGINGKPIRVVYEDSKSEPKAAVDALRKVISSDKVPVVIGDVASSNVLAMAPVAEGEKVILISPGASNPDISNAGDYIFRNFPSDALEGKVDAEYAYRQLGWRKIALLNIRNAYGEGISRVFKKGFTELGGTMALEDSFDQGTTDFRTQLTKLKGAAPDGVFLAGYPDEMARLLIQAKELQIKTPFLSTQAFDDPQVLKIAGQAAEGVIFSTPAPPSDTDPKAAEFRQNYKRKFGKEPGLMSDTAYDAMKMIALAITKGGYSGPGIRDQLASLKNYLGAAGPTTFDQFGDVPRPVMFKVVRDVKFVELGYRVEPH